MNSKSLRKRRAVIDKISSIHVANISSPSRSKMMDVYEEYLDSAAFTEEEIETFHAILDQRLVSNVSNYVEPRMAAKTMLVTEVEDLIDEQPWPDFREILWQLLETWKMKHIGPVVALAEIVDDEQNIHTRDVEKKTTDGVILLGKVPVPEDQKTLAEFEAAIREIMIPVKYDTVREMLAYLSSQKDFPLELNKALRRIYIEEKENQAELVRWRSNHIIYVVSNTHEVTDAEDSDSDVTEITETLIAEDSDSDVTEITETLIAEDSDSTDVTEITEVAEENTPTNHVKSELDILYAEKFKGIYSRENWEYIYSKYYNTVDKAVLNHFATAPIPSEVSSMLYACYYKAYYEKLYDAESKIKKTLEDMKDWGRRPSVMAKGENVYKATLRGLWAKIKTYEPELKGELVKRLFEEASEAVGLCADGHVGRLCNVLVGFDPEFTCSLSPMEYFQNNIALIAGNIHAPQSTKILQAKALMDEMKMPEEEREAWLDAL
jgi:hypothetical protein